MKNMDSKDLHNEQTKKRRRRKWYYTISLTMAAVVVFCTVYALILPAITMEKQQQELSCALDIHQHTESCYDSVGNLICGEADFVIHTHDNKCSDANGNRVCKLPAVAAHKHSSSCYNDKDKLICKLPEVEEHNHNNLCYDKDGTLICGKLHTIKHVHGTACFRSSGTSGSTNDEAAAENMIMPLSDTATASILGEDCGYNSDGSIWWGGLSDTQFGVNEIQENTPYLISGYQGNNLMADETYTKGGAKYLKAIPKEQMTDYKQYERWYFEKTNEDGKYYIYFLKTNEDGSNTPLYLKYAGSGVVEWNKKTQQTVLTNDKTQATVFTVAQCTKSAYPRHITVSAVVDGKTFYINSYFGDKPESNGNTTHWLGYEEYSEGSFLRVSQFNPNSENTAKRVATDTSTNSVINLFDYWLTDNQTDPDWGNPADDSTLKNGGINNGHDFKFTKGTARGSFDLNYWTGKRELPRQGMVSPNLVNKYPVLSGKSEINGTDSTESLAYVFNPDIPHEGKKSYKNVGGLLTLDNEGYYSYDCYKNMAEFDEKSNYIRLYDKPGVTGSGDTGQFFPFNKAPQIMTAGREDSVINHYFGMTITTRFIQRHDGFTDERKNKPTSFHFSGDDDVWIFIDDVLVGDVGGLHDAASIDIDFSTGDVKIAVAGVDNPKTITTNIKKCYENAGKVGSVKWNGNTFANNSMHTLKFFYLERGNYASNLSLKFNLTEIPTTAIEKTDEYNNPVEGAKFAVYAARGETDNDEIYNMLFEKGGAVVTLPDEVTYADNGNILDSSGNILANALYVGTTDSNGKLPFLDEDGMPYTLEELEEKFGPKFILRELEVPDKYRLVSDDVHLKVYHGETQKVLVSDQAQESGARATTDLHTTATDTIYLREKNQDPTQNSPVLIPQQYCDPETGNPYGTLFAVVVKYTGETVGDRLVPDTEVNNLLSSTKYWTPVYGNDEDGYKLVKKTDSKDFYAAAIEAANEKVKFNETKLREDKGNIYTEEQISDKKYEGVALQRKANGTMQLFMDDLPGHIRYYYNLLPKDRKNYTRYTVAYFWTNTTLEQATSENTYLVNTRPATVNDTIYGGFERTFSAQINVPNLLNDVYVQKLDENSKLTDGATFAMYQVKQADNGEILYLAETADGTESYISLPKDAKPDKDTGVITVDGKTITPPKIDGKPAVAVTGNLQDGVHNEGTVRFKNLPRGQYIIKEVKAPPGYSLNTTDIMVLVTEDTIYANAGTEDDGVTVGRGPGYLVSPMHSLASEGEINNTLTWIYAQMQISEPSTSFADVGDASKIKGYLAKNNSSETTNDRSQGFRTNLIYASGKEGTAFNYVPDPARNAGTDSDGYRRLFTTSGWPQYEVYQDYDYGSVQAAKNGADYYNWSGDQITRLYSRSTYIRVTDESEVTLKVKKVDSSNEKVLLSGAQFRLYRLNSHNEKEYYVRDSADNVSWNTNADAAMVVTTGTDGMSTPDFTKLKDGTYYLEEIKSPDGYYRQPKPVELTINKSKMTLNSSSKCSVDEGVLDENNFYTFTVTVPNGTGFELPSTGGSGTFMYTAGGILLIAISLVYGYRRKRRSERRFNQY